MGSLSLVVRTLIVAALLAALVEGIGGWAMEVPSPLLLVPFARLMRKLV